MSTPDPLAQGGHSDAMDIDQSKKRDADSLFVHEDEEDEVGHNSKRQKQDLDSAYASQSQGGTPEQDHDSPPQSPRKTSSRKHKPTIIVVDGKVPGLKQWMDDRRPCLAVYYPTFKQSAQEVTRAWKCFNHQYTLLKQKGYYNPEIEHIVAHGKFKWHYPESCYPTVKPVVLLGAAGAGKSSGLNCYLDKTAAAVETDSGNRGTKTVHEYSTAGSDQISEYRVIARYASLKTIKTEVHKHCNAIFDWRNHESGQLDDQDTDLRNKHDTAMAFFTALLADREDFTVGPGEEDYFGENSGEDVNDLVAELLDWIKGLLDRKGIVAPGMTQTLDAHNEQELNSIFTELCGPASENADSRGKVSTWPLIVQIDILLANDLLDDGVKIGDAPGVTDTNHTVVQKTKDYLKRAGTIFVFTTAERVQNNPELDRNLTECIHLGKMHSTYLIVTKIDQKSAFKTTDLDNLRAEDRARYQDAEDRVQTLKLDRDVLKAAKGALKTLEEYKANEDSTKEVELDIKKAEMMVQQVAVQIRNRDVERMVSNKFRELDGSRTAPDLKVIFTSNWEYQKHLTGYDVEKPPMLDLQATGIPEVQEVLYRVPAIGKTYTLGRIIEVHLPSIFNGIIGTLTKSRLERKAEVLALIKNHFEEQIEIAMRIASELTASYTERIRAIFTANQGKWMPALQAKLEGWAKYKSPTFAAFCRRKGVWKIDGKPLNWNYEIQEVYRAKLNGAFNLLDDDLDEIESGLNTSINSSFQDLERKLEACEGLQGADYRPFFEQIRLFQEALTDKVTTDFQETVRDAVRELRNTATLASEYTCINEIMEDTYKKCAELKTADFLPPASTTPSKGAGKAGTAKPKPKPKKGGVVHAARVEELRKKLAGDGGVTGVTDALAQELRTRYTPMVKAFDGQLKEDLAFTTQAVLKDFDSRFQTAAPTTEEDAAAVETLKNEARIALESIQGAKALYAEAVAYETANASA